MCLSRWQIPSSNQNGEANQDEDIKLQQKAAREIMKESAAFLEKSVSNDSDNEVG